MKCRWMEGHECKRENPRMGGYGEGVGGNGKTKSLK